MSAAAEALATTPAEELQAILFKAVSDKKIRSQADDIVKELKKRGDPLNSLSGALRVAVETGDKRTVEKVIAYGGASPTVADDNDPMKTAILMAVEKENIPVLEALNTNYNCLNANNGYETPLTHACKLESTKMIDYLIAQRVSAGARDANGDTAFTWAVLNNKKKVRTHLVGEGGSAGGIDATDSRNRTPLMIAVILDDKKQFEFLIEHGASIYNTQDHFGENVAMKAAVNNNVKMLTRIMKSSHMGMGTRDNLGMTLLAKAAYHGSTECVEWLLDNGCRTFDGDNQGWTALMHAASQNHADVCVALMKFGHNKTTTNHCGKRACDIAADLDYADLAEALTPKE